MKRKKNYDFANFQILLKQQCSTHLAVLDKFFMAFGKEMENSESFITLSGFYFYGAVMEINDEERRELEEKLKGMSPEELKEFQEQQCIFCQIIAGKVPSKKVYEDDKCIAIMDINPAAIGHVLLLPKEHYMIMPQIPEETLGWLFMAAKHLSQAMLRRFKVEGTNIFVANGPVAGQRAQHFMVHIIPRKEGDGILEIPEHLVEEEVRKRLGGVIKEKANVHKKVELFWHPENPPKADFHDFAGKKKEVRGKGEGERGKGGEGRALK